MDLEASDFVWKTIKFFIVKQAFYKECFQEQVLVVVDLWLWLIA